jgi:hypothetical protein
MSRVHEFVEKHDNITRLEFYTVYGPNGVSRVDDGRRFRFDDITEGGYVWVAGTGRITGVRRGFGTYFWTAAVRSGFLQPSNERRDGYMVYEKGPRYDEWSTRIKLETENVA